MQMNTQNTDATIREWEDGEELFEYLYADNPAAGLHELLARAKNVPAEAVTKKEVADTLGAHLCDETPVSHIKAVAEALNAGEPWAAVIAEAFVSFVDGMAAKNEEEILRVWRRTRELDPTYQWCAELVAATVFSFSGSGEPEADAARIKAVFATCGIDPLSAFSGDCALPMSRSFAAAQLIADTAWERRIPPKELKAKLHPAWWAMLQEHAHKQWVFLRRGDHLGIALPEHEPASRASIYWEEAGRA